MLEPISKIPPARVADDFLVSARRGKESCSFSYRDAAATQRDEKIAATHTGYGQFPQYRRRLLLGVQEAHPRRLLGLAEIGSYRERRYF